VGGGAQNIRKNTEQTGRNVWRPKLSEKNVPGLPGFLFQNGGKTVSKHFAPSERTEKTRPGLKKKKKRKTKGEAPKRIQNLVQRKVSSGLTGGGGKPPTFIPSRQQRSFVGGGARVAKEGGKIKIGGGPSEKNFEQVRARPVSVLAVAW